MVAHLALRSHLGGACHIGFLPQCWVSVSAWKMSTTTHSNPRCANLGLPCRVHITVTDPPSPYQISLSVSVAKAQCSLFNQLTLVDRQEDFGAVHFEDAVVRLAKWDDGQLVRVRLAYVTRW